MTVVGLFTEFREAYKEAKECMESILIAEDKESPLFGVIQTYVDRSEDKAVAISSLPILFPQVVNAEEAALLNSGNIANMTTILAEHRKQSFHREHTPRLIALSGTIAKEIPHQENLVLTLTNAGEGCYRVIVSGSLQPPNLIYRFTGKVPTSADLCEEDYNLSDDFYPYEIVPYDETMATAFGGEVLQQGVFDLRHSTTPEDIEAGVKHVTGKNPMISVYAHIPVGVTDKGYWVIVRPFEDKQNLALAYASFQEVREQSKGLFRSIDSKKVPFRIDLTQQEIGECVSRFLRPCLEDKFRIDEDKCGIAYSRLCLW